MLKRIAKNTTFILLGNVINKISSIVILFFFSRYLEAAGFGLFSFTFFYVGLFGSMTDLGIKTILVRELSRPRDNKELYLGNSILLAFSGTLFAVMLASVIPFFLNYKADVRMLIIITSFSLLFSFRDLTFRQIYESVFQVELKMEYPTIINAINEVLVVALSLLVILFKGSLQTLLLVYVAGYIPGFICMVYYSNRCIKPKFDLNWPLMKEIVKTCLPLGAAVALFSIYDKIGGVLVQGLKGNEAVGYYSLAYRVAVSLKIIPMALMISLFPILSDYYTSAREQFMKYFNAAVKYVLLIAVPVAFGITLFSNQIIRLISGEGFLPAGPALVYIMWAVVFLFINIVFFYTLISINRQIVTLFVSFVMLIANIVLNIVLINKYSFIGAALTLLLTEMIGLCFGLFFVKKFIPDFSLAVFLKVIISAAGMLIIILLPIPSVIKYIIAVGVFVGIAFITKLLTVEEIKLVRALKKKKPSDQT